VGELSAQLGVSEEEVTGALGLRDFYRHAPLEQSWQGPDGDEAGPLDGQIGVVDPLLETLELRLALRQLLEALPERLRDLIRLRHFQGLSQQEVGQRLGISQMHVSRLERQTLARLRQEIPRVWGEPDVPAS
jgi:RNA polymerase sigma-B factor